MVSAQIWGCVIHEYMNAGPDFDWNQARAFLATVQEGSLSAAARVLGSSQPTVGRHVSALEEELGVVLFERVGNQLSPTPIALQLAEHVRAMESAAWRLSLTAASQSQQLTGTVAISASEGVSVFLLPPILRRLRQAHPGIHLDVRVSNQVSDLSRREADIAVRNFRPRTPDLIARRIRDAQARLYASPDYLERIGRPASLEAIARAEFIAFDDQDTYLEWLQSLGMPLTRQAFTLVSGSHMTQWALARAGAGIAMLMDEVADRDPGLERVSDLLPPVPVPLWLTTRRELHTNRRVRLVFDQLVEGLAVRAGEGSAEGEV